jgi:hypothetical protein
MTKFWISRKIFNTKIILTVHKTLLDSVFIFVNLPKKENLYSLFLLSKFYIVYLIMIQYAIEITLQIQASYNS